MKAFGSLGVIAGAALGLLALAAPASAQTASTPSNSQCASTSATVGAPCADETLAPSSMGSSDDLSNQPLPEAVGPESGSSINAGIDPSGDGGIAGDTVTGSTGGVGSDSGM